MPFPSQKPLYYFPHVPSVASLPGVLAGLEQCRPQVGAGQLSFFSVSGK